MFLLQFGKTVNANLRFYARIELIFIVTSENNFARSGFHRDFLAI